MNLGYKINIRLLTMRGFHPMTAAGDGCEIEVTGFPPASIKRKEARKDLQKKWTNQSKDCGKNKVTEL